MEPKEAAADGRNVSRRLITGTDADADAARSWHSGLKPSFGMPPVWNATLLGFRAWPDSQTQADIKCLLISSFSFPVVGFVIDDTVV